ncbi:MAG: ATP-binding protein [Dongiaceae bacterium]
MTGSRATLHFVCGKAASGKTTLARDLAARHGAALFCEDEWLTLLEASIVDLGSFDDHARRLRSALAPHLAQLLRIGTSVVLDFAGNTPEERGWVRSIFEAAGAGHRLHVILACDGLCKARLRQRNETKPAGLYFGPVSEALFDEVTRYFVPPADAEGFMVTSYDAASGCTEELRTGASG